MVILLQVQLLGWDCHLSQAFSLLNPVAISIAKFFPVYYVISAAENPSTDFSSYAFNLGMVLLFGILYVALAFSIQQIRTRQFGRSLKKA